MKRFCIELMIALGYAALIAFCACCFLVVTAHGDDGYHFRGIQGTMLMVLGVISFVGIIVYAIWDWDREPIVHFITRILMILLRLAAVLFLFFPFFFLWVQVLVLLFS